MGKQPAVDPITGQPLWTPERIKELLARSDAAVERALVVLYHRQTSDEQRTDDAKYQNKVGFGAFDAEFGSSLAKTVLEQGHLTAGQMAHGRKLMMRYARQLADAANKKARGESDIVPEEPRRTPLRPSSPYRSGSDDWPERGGGGIHSYRRRHGTPPRLTR